MFQCTGQVQCSRILARIHACVRCGDADRVPAVDSTYSIHVPVGTSRSIRTPVVDLVVSTTVYACARVRSPMPFIIAMHAIMHRIASHVVVHVRRRRRPAAAAGTINGSAAVRLPSVTPLLKASAPSSRAVADGGLAWQHLASAWE